MPPLSIVVIVALEFEFDVDISANGVDCEGCCGCDCGWDCDCCDDKFFDLFSEIIDILLVLGNGDGFRIIVLDLSIECD